MRFRRGVSSRVLSCGCLVGLYETYDETVVAVVDVSDPGCARHVRGTKLDSRTVMTAAAGASAAESDRGRPAPDVESS